MKKDLQISKLFILVKCSDNKIRPLLPASNSDQIELMNGMLHFLEKYSDKIILTDIPVIIVPEPKE
jgi:hypothetical protein